LYDGILKNGSQLEVAVRIISPKAVAGKHLQGGFSSSIKSRLDALTASATPKQVTEGILGSPFSPSLPPPLPLLFLRSFLCFFLLSLLTLL
jgi:hypothetical protein